MKDQCGNIIDINSLVLITTLFMDEQKNFSLTKNEIKLVLDADWFDVTVDMGDNEKAVILCVRANEIDYLSKEPISGNVVSLLQIDDVLKRWTLKGGFYHI